MPCNYKLYPRDWKTVVRPRIMARARNRCEACGLPHYAVFRTLADGSRERAAGTLHHDAAGNGELSYKEARELASHLDEVEPEEGRWAVCVLTIAHLNHDVTDNRDENLRALCNRCHLRYDAHLHASNAALTRARKAGQGALI